MDQDQTISVLVTSGNGPEECCIAVVHIVDQIRSEAAVLGLTMDVSETRSLHGCKSAVVIVRGVCATRILQNWVGTIQWTCKSQLRPHHKRQNWFVSVVKLKMGQDPIISLRLQDISFESFRAGGPGGQHQNTTDSAVRAIHKPTGLCVVAREMRSQHRNKALAIERMQQVMDAQAISDQAAGKMALNQHHDQVQRGNPTRCFKGRKFREVKRK